MIILLSALLLLALLSAVIMFFSKNDEENKDAVPASEPDPDCCGAHEHCEQELKKLSTDIIYFEDEELDSFSGKTETYQSDDIELFREVLYTLQQEEITEWLHSLELRNIVLPEILKPEARMLLTE